MNTTTASTIGIDLAKNVFFLCVLTPKAGFRPACNCDTPSSPNGWPSRHPARLSPWRPAPAGLKVLIAEQQAHCCYLEERLADCEERIGDSLTELLWNA
ncbi:MAG: hypothetical protein Q7T36_14315 [Fluviicoccus sp.]|uniref:hypothetical protein n=1 Tax=Fluviicoccus sp. TaxID=2003552 RepID=UPI00271E777C|nr:hypothetical protein [Fluviicoccus sp.]MDO8331636.1 hypothetical protein [Fluviicoccus sp.]